MKQKFKKCKNTKEIIRKKISMKIKMKIEITKPK